MRTAAPLTGSPATAAAELRHCRGDHGAQHGSAAWHGADVWVIDAPAAPEFDRVRPLALANGTSATMSA